MVCGTALGIVGSIAASEDVAQDSFLTAWRKIHELREPERLRPWLRQITRHAALGHLRGQRGHHGLEDAPDLPDSSPAPDEQAANEEEVAMVRIALTQLPTIYREPLILYYREHQSTKAVAEALEISEDAVRQRLARGRELLRDQISDVVERVITRTGPTTIFTMTIAVAIGALTSPAAVASGVFTAAASSTTPSGFLSKACSTSKSFLFMVAIATVTCIPVGYHIGTTTPSKRVPTLGGGEGAKAVPRNSLGAIENSAIFAEWKRLHDVHGTNVEAMPKILREITGFQDSLRRQGFRAALLAEWVQLNPTNAMAGFRDRIIDPSQRRQFVEEWLARDAVEAIEVFMKGGRSWEATVRNALTELARRAPARVASVVARLSKPDSSREKQVCDAFAIVAEGGIDSARSSAETLPGPNRDQALCGVAQTWGKRDLESATAWARKLSDGADQDEVIRWALVGAASIDPVSALERVNLVPPGGRKGYFASTTGARVLERAATTDFDATVGWLATHRGSLGEEDLLGLASSVGEKLNAAPAGFLTQYASAGSLAALLPAITNALVKESSGQRSAVWDWLREQPDDSTTRQLRHQLLSTWGEQDTAAALRLADEAPPTPEGDSQLQLLAEGLLGHGSVLHRLDRLLESAPPRLQQLLAKSAFNYLTLETMGAPERWVSLIAKLPENARALASRTLARVWAAQSPEEAVGWATAMPDGGARVEAVAGIASTWAAEDAPAAAIWIAAMTPGLERDRSAQALVQAIAEEFPREAWEWATSIVDTERRIGAAAHAARMMAARDSVIARAWIENGPFTQEAKAVLRSALETTRRTTQ